MCNKKRSMSTQFGSIRQNLIRCMSYIEMVVCFMTLLNIHIFVSLLIVIHITCSCCIVGRRPLFTNKRWMLNYCSKEDKFTGDIEQHLIFVCPLYHNLRVSYSKPCWIAAIVWEQLNKRIMLDTSKHGTKLLPRLFISSAIYQHTSSVSGRFLYNASIIMLGTFRNFKSV